MNELEPVPNQEKLVVIKELLDRWVSQGELTAEQGLEFYTEVAQILTSEEP